PGILIGEKSKDAISVCAHPNVMANAKDSSNRAGWNLIACEIRSASSDQQAGLAFSYARAHPKSAAFVHCQCADEKRGRPGLTFARHAVDNRQHSATHRAGHDLIIPERYTRKSERSGVFPIGAFEWLIQKRQRMS